MSALLAVWIQQGKPLNDINAVVNDIASKVFGGSTMLQFVPRVIRYFKSSGRYRGTLLFSALLQDGMMIKH